VLILVGYCRFETPSPGEFMPILKNPEEMKKYLRGLYSNNTGP
jgi:hypothetical protein